MPTPNNSHTGSLRLIAFTSNFFLTASVGGNLDPMLARYAHVFKRIAHVVYTEQEATDLGLEIDHDDSHCFGDKPFALLVHGVQRKGSLASEALSKRKRRGNLDRIFQVNTCIFKRDMYYLHVPFIFLCRI